MLFHKINETRGTKKQKMEQAAQTLFAAML
jgi:hypothetical protein